MEKHEYKIVRSVERQIRTSKGYGVGGPESECRDGGVRSERREEWRVCFNLALIGGRPSFRGLVDWGNGEGRKGVERCKSSGGKGGRAGTRDNPEDERSKDGKSTTGVSFWFLSSGEGQLGRGAQKQG